MRMTAIRMRLTHRFVFPAIALAWAALVVSTSHSPGAMAAPASVHGQPAEDADGQAASPGQDARHQGSPSLGRRRGGPPPALWHRLSEEEQLEVESFIETHFPRMYLELSRLRDRQPDRFARRMARIVPDLRDLMELMDLHPERAMLLIRERKLDMQIRHLVRRFRRADESERPTIKKELRELCAYAFDCRQERRALEIEDLEVRIDAMRQRHEEATASRDELVDQELEARLSRPRHGRKRGEDHGERGQWKPDENRKGKRRGDSAPQKGPSRGAQDDD